MAGGGLSCAAGGAVTGGLTFSAGQSRHESQKISARQGGKHHDEEQNGLPRRERDLVMSAGLGHACYLSFGRNALSRSIGSGKTMVEFFSLASSVSV